MALKDYEPMDDQDILVALEKNIMSAVGHYDSELSREREKVTQYYNALQYFFNCLELCGYNISYTDCTNLQQT